MNDELISHYRVSSRIGAGGMGEVYLAEDMTLHRRVALKLLPVEFNPDAERVARFHQEARAASALNHPNILTVFEVGEAEGRHFIATEFIDGETLRQCIERGPIPVRQAIAIAIDVASALVASHDAGIIHRDIKPENVMIRRDGYVKVLDFGLAKLVEPQLLGAAGRNQPSTEPGLVMGTVHYMSPEQLRGEPADPRSDIFSLGQVLYEMLAGRPPFRAPSSSEVIVAILEHDPAPLDRFVRRLPSRLAALVERALAKDVTERFQRVDALRAELQSIERDFQLEGHVYDERTAELPVATRREGSGAGRILRQVRANRELLAGLALIVILIALSFQFLASRRVSYGSIAVLPFANAVRDEETEYLSDGITESIIHSLSQIKELQVIARSTVFQYKDPDVDPRKVGRELKVSAVVTGRIIQRDSTLIVSADLIDVARGTQLWGARYARDATDVLRIQSEIATEISETLRLRLTGEEIARFSDQHRGNDEAYRLYLRGRHQWNKRTADGLRRALDYFEQAIAMQPDYALAFAGLADSYTLIAVYGAMPASEAYPRARAAATRALELDDRLAEAHTSLAWGKMNFDRDWPGAESGFRRALELNRSYPTAHQWYALFLASRGRHDEALREIRRALELDPLSPVISLNVGTIHYLAGRFDVALEAFQRAAAMEPGFARGQLELARVYELKGMTGPAITILEELSRSGEPAHVCALARAYALAGRKTEALDLVDGLFTDGMKYVNPYDIAAVHAALGDRTQVMIWLEHAYAENVSRLAYLEVEPMFREMRADPRFVALTRRLNHEP